MRIAESMLGALEYIRLTFLFMVLSILCQQSIHHLLTRTRFGERSSYVVGLGFSCIAFTWMTWASMRQPSSTIDLMFVKLPIALSPFGSLIMTQLMIPNVDFVGHLAGILAG